MINISIKLRRGEKFGNARSAAAKIARDAMDAAREVASDVKGAMREVAADVKEAAGEVAADVKEAVGETAADAKEAAAEVAADAKEAAKELMPQSVKDLCTEAQRDIDAICERDPAVKSRAEAALLYSGFHAIMAYRVANKLYKKEKYTSARLISQTARFLTGVEIHPGATIGKGLFIDHGSGVVIGETTVIGDNCTLYQGVTLGGTGKDCGKRHPTLGDNVMVGAGAKVLGNFTVGSDSKIAAGAVVLGPVPENCTAVGIPAHIVRRDGKRVDKIDLDQVHIPDPVSQELCALSGKVRELEEKVKALGGDSIEVDTSKTVSDCLERVKSNGGCGCGADNGGAADGAQSESLGGTGENDPQNDGGAAARDTDQSGGGESD